MSPQSSSRDSHRSEHTPIGLRARGQPRTRNMWVGDAITKPRPGTTPGKGDCEDGCGDGIQGHPPGDALPSVSQAASRQESSRVQRTQGLTPDSGELVTKPLIPFLSRTSAHPLGWGWGGSSCGERRPFGTWDKGHLDTVRGQEHVKRN